MSRQEAEKLVRERWARLGLGKPSDFPVTFSMDVADFLDEQNGTNEGVAVWGKISDYLIDIPNRLGI